MHYFFEYNWQVRNAWFALCKTIPRNILYEKRIGGIGCFAETFFHIVKVEYDWICDLQQQPIRDLDFQNFQNFEDIVQLSKELNFTVKKYIKDWSSEKESKILHMDFGGGNYIHCTYGEALRHLIAHEIHHIGQLSIWAREIKITPINSNFIHRGIFIDT